MEHVHVLADHGAWLLYGAGALYKLLPSVSGCWRVKPWP